MSGKPSMLPRDVKRATRLVAGGSTDCVVVYPAQGPAYGDLAQAVADAMERRTRVRPALVKDTEIIHRRNAPLPEEYRSRPLILLGCINTNRVLLPLYARFYCATDAGFPGEDGYDLRTMVNPYGAGVNFVLVGGSTPHGVERAVERLTAWVDDAGEPGELVLPFLLEVELGSEMARRMSEWPDPAYKVSGDIPGDLKRPHSLGEWPETSRDVPVPQTDGGLISIIGPYAILYAWTGERKFGQYASDCLRALNARAGESYGDWHYAIERIVRAVPWLAAGGFLDEAEILRTDQLLLGTAIGTQGMWWRKRDGRPPLGHRHLGKGTFAFYLQARYLRDQARPNEAARQMCDRWIVECRAYLDALAQARADDQDDESTLNNLTTVFWYALGEERFEFFENGNARQCTERAIAVHDNMGAGAGVEGYGEALPASMYLQQDLVAMVGASALYYRDGEFKRVTECMPTLRTPTRMILWTLSPAFMHRFEVGSEVASRPPRRLVGLQILPLSDYQIDIISHPPEYRPRMGISIDEPEKWELHNGVRPNQLPKGLAFDKLVLRKSFASQDPYLLLQGYTEPFRWQGSMHAANAIVRFSQGGHIFLIQNTDRQSYFHKNGVFISDGYNDSTFPPLAEWVAADDFDGAALSATRLNDAHHVNWTRYLFWSKAGDGYFVVLDTLEARQEGPYAFVCTWRTPGYAELAGRRWRARQGQHVFTLCTGQSLAMRSEEQGIQGAANPYVLHQRQEGAVGEGELVTFQNLFYVRKRGQEEGLDLRYLTPTQAVVVSGEGRSVAWCGADPLGTGMEWAGLGVYSASAMVTREGVFASGATRIELVAGAGYRVVSDRPVGVQLDLVRWELRVQADGPDSIGAQVRVEVGPKAFTLEISDREPQVHRLTREECDRATAWVIEWLATLASGNRSEGIASGIAPEWPEGGWRMGLRFERWKRVTERVRDVTIATEPPPVDGFPEQLTDTVFSEWRDSIVQWPRSTHYEVQLELGHDIELDRLRLVGDSLVQPTLRTFRRLPDDIRVAVSSDGFQKDIRGCIPEPRRGILKLQRWHGWEDRFETLEVPVEAKARQVRIRISSPPGGGPLVCHEVELYGKRRVAPSVQWLVPADLNGDGHREVVAVGMADRTSASREVAGEIVVLDEQGAERWRWESPNLITHVSCHDLDGDGRRQVCVGLLGSELAILEPEGSVRQILSFARYNDETPDNFFGSLYGIEGLAVWHREPDGRAGLVIGTYGMQVFLDPDGRPLGHSWGGGGAWQSGLLACPPAVPGVKDLWVRNRWHQGICIYKGQLGLEPSGEFVVFGGVRQSMFRPLHKMLSFVSGRTITFEWIESSESAGGLILAAAETGVGVLSFSEEEWLWKNESGGPITACIAVGREEGRPAEVIVGGAGGFVAAFGQLDGRPSRRLQTGAPVVGLACWPGTELLAVATQEGVLALDRDWQVQGFYPVAARRMCSLGTGKVLVAREEGPLEVLSFENQPSGVTG